MTNHDPLLERLGRATPRSVPGAERLLERADAEVRSEAAAGPLPLAAAASLALGALGATPAWLDASTVETERTAFAAEVTSEAIERLRAELAPPGDSE